LLFEEKPLELELKRNEYSELNRMSYEGDLKGVKEQVEGRGLNVNREDGYRNTAMHYACEGGNFEVLKYLIEKGGNIEVKSVDETSLLHVAGLGGNVKTIEYLLSKGLDVNEEDREGMTILHILSHRGNVEGVRYVLDQGAELEHRDKRKEETALMIAIEVGQAGVVRELLSRGASMGREIEDYRNAQYYALNNKEVVHEILDYLEGKAKSEEEKETIGLDWWCRAISLRNVKGVESMLERGWNTEVNYDAETSKKDREGRTALERMVSYFYAGMQFEAWIYEDKYKIIEMLLSRGAEAGREWLADLVESSEEIKESLVSRGIEHGHKNWNTERVEEIVKKYRIGRGRKLTLEEIELRAEWK